jgi:hypothetical protein
VIAVIAVNLVLHTCGGRFRGWYSRWTGSLLRKGLCYRAAVLAMLRIAVISGADDVACIVGRRATGRKGESRMWTLLEPDVRRTRAVRPGLWVHAASARACKRCRAVRPCKGGDATVVVQSLLQVLAMWGRHRFAGIAR